jgi:transposase
METMERKQTRTRRSFTPEFKAEIVELCRRGDRSVGQVSRDFDLTETAVRAWVRQAEIDDGQRDGLTSEERTELTRLRRENRSLKEDVEVLKRATAFFAKETRLRRTPSSRRRRSPARASTAPVACSRSPGPPSMHAASRRPTARSPTPP